MPCLMLFGAIPADQYMLKKHITISHYITSTVCLQCTLFLKGWKTLPAPLASLEQLQLVQKLHLEFLTGEPRTLFKKQKVHCRMLFVSLCYPIWIHVWKHVLWFGKVLTGVR